MSGSLINGSKPVLLEGFLVILIGLLIIWNITTTDIEFHGKYVGFLIEQCHPENHDKLCDDFREHLGVPNDAQMQLGDAYWSELARQAFTVGVTMAAIRFSFAYILHKAHIQKIRSSSILMAVMYGVVGYGLFIFGTLDLMYFVFQSQTIPTNLNWLDHAGIFEITKAWTGDKTTVDASDLYLTNLTGFILIGIVLLSTMFAFKESGMKKAIA